jgi:hypothetical protein
VEIGEYLVEATSGDDDHLLQPTMRWVDWPWPPRQYDPKPPHGGIQWSTVDRDIYAPVLAQQLQAALADKPQLLQRLTD